MSNLKKKLKLGVLGGGINSAVGRAHLSALRLDGLFDITNARVIHITT
jgi:hypothetical protein